MQDAAQSVRLHDRNLHQLASHAVQDQTCLLLFALDRHFAKMRLLDGYPDRLRVTRIVLVGHAKGPDLIGGEQLDEMALRGQCPAPVMWAATGFKSNDAGRAIGKKWGDAIAFQFLALDLTGFRIDDMKLENVFFDVHTDVRQLCTKPHDRASIASGDVASPLWHIDAVCARLPSLSDILPVSGGRRPYHLPEFPGPPLSATIES